MRVISVDLAYKAYGDIGVVVLDATDPSAPVTKAIVQSATAWGISLHGGLAFAFGRGVDA